MKLKFPQLKRYSHEGSCGFIPLLETLFIQSHQHGVENIVLGMPHRGRLNVLMELLQIPPEIIFGKASGGSEIGLDSIDFAEGDVLSHIHITSQFDTEAPPNPSYPDQLEWYPSNASDNRNSSPTSPSGVLVSLQPNPSHLEAVNPVVQGKVWSMQREIDQSNGVDIDELRMKLTNERRNYVLGDSLEQFTSSLTPGQKSVLGIVVHGESAWAGQGVVAETLQMANVPDFTVRGTIHIIVNNQVGFSLEGNRSRSSLYSADLAKFLQSPILHVNAESPAHLAFAGTLAATYRQQFGQDIIIEIHGYRQYGHNEIDAPGPTQPHMYDSIQNTEPYTVRLLKELDSQGLWTKKDQKSFAKSQNKRLDQAYKTVKSASPFYAPENSNTGQGHWKGIKPLSSVTHHDYPSEINADPNLLREIAKSSVTFPDDFAVHPILNKGHIQSRLAKIEANSVDWAMAEAIAFGYLTLCGHNVRLSGQDVGRGTFFHRHGLLVDSAKGPVSEYIPLNALASDLVITDNNSSSKATKGHITFANSPLSEESVFGFEYGVSIHSPRTLTIVECQFGDFFTNAQTMIDQFITSGARKWLRQSSMSILLPHGLDGAGPEHSSGRIERWLQLVDEDFGYHPSKPRPVVNLQVLSCTTASNYFHSLIRQQLRPFRVPMVMMTPKILLRDPLAATSFEELASGSFQPVIDDPSPPNPDDTKTLAFCAGKVYYDLSSVKNDHTRLIRIEELSPFPFEQVKALLDQFPKASIVWVQEEAQNNGCFAHVLPRFLSLGVAPRCISRPPSSVPATGFSFRHKAQKANLLDEFANV